MRFLLGFLASLGMSLIGAFAWALLDAYTPFEVGFVAFGIGWLAGKGMYLGRGKKGDVVGAVSASAIAVLAFALAKLMAIEIGLLNGSIISVSDWGLAWKQSFGGLDLLWMGFAVWPAWRVAQSGQDL